MNVIIAVSIVVASIIMMLFQFVKNYRYKEMINVRAMQLPWVLLALAVTVLINVIAVKSLSSYTLLLDVLLGTCALMLVSSSFWNTRSCFKMLSVYALIDILMIIYYALVALDVIPPMNGRTLTMAAAVFPVTMILIIAYGIWRFLHNTKVVLRSGTVWHSVCVCVESVYLLSIIVVVCIVESCAVMSDSEYYVYPAIFLLWLTLMALSFRIYEDNLMILCPRMERRILESLKVSVAEVPNEVTRSDTAFQEIYDRIVAYFETDKPYLNHDLVIEDLVKVVFSNKLYISRAISQITGRNFCQFVNYYRIMHSVETFRHNPELKVTELANISGFNSLVSFSMAFRLYMNENPSDWIRKERNRMAKSMFKSIN